MRIVSKHRVTASWVVALCYMAPVAAPASWADASVSAEADFDGDFTTDVTDFDIDQTNAAIAGSGVNVVPNTAPGFTVDYNYAATADLPAGTIGISGELTHTATEPIFGSEVPLISVFANIDDTLHFQSNLSTYEVVFTLTIDGEVDNQGVINTASHASAELTGGTFDSVDILPNGTYNGVVLQTTDMLNYNDDTRFNASLFMAILDLDVGGSVMFDFINTATLEVTIPQGVSFTGSTNGFANVSQVPIPAAASLMLTALLGLFAGGRFRREW